MVNAFDIYDVLFTQDRLIWLSHPTIDDLKRA